MSLQPFLMSFNLQGSCNAPCSSFLMECFHLRSSPFYSFFQDCSTSQGSLVSLLCRRSNFVLPLPLPFLSGAISRISGRDPLLVWESCDARRPTSQKIPEDSRCSGFSRVFHLCLCYLFCIASCHHAIMSYFFCIST